MSTAIDHTSGQARVKLRRQLTVAVLSFASFGIYSIVWYYKINREMRDFGAAHDDDGLAASRPWLSVLAISIGGLLVIPQLVSLVRTVKRVQTVERIVWGAARPAAGIIGMLVTSVTLSLGACVHRVGTLLEVASLVTFVAAITLVQGRLNAAWRAAGAIPDAVEDFSR